LERKKRFPPGAAGKLKSSPILREENREAGKRKKTPSADFVQEGNLLAGLPGRPRNEDLKGGRRGFSKSWLDEPARVNPEETGESSDLQDCLVPKKEGASQLNIERRAGTKG